MRALKQELDAAAPIPRFHSGEEKCFIGHGPVRDF
jgi:hypothetical protein